MPFWHVFDNKNSFYDGLGHPYTVIEFTKWI